MGFADKGEFEVILNINFLLISWILHAIIFLINFLGLDFWVFEAFHESKIGVRKPTREQSLNFESLDVSNIEWIEGQISRFLDFCGFIGLRKGTVVTQKIHQRRQMGKEMCV